MYCKKSTYTNIACFTLNKQVFFEGIAKMSAAVELTVDEHNNSNGENEPLVHNSSEMFLLKTFESTGDFREDTTEIRMNRGEVEHSFFAQPGRTYRLGVIARVDASHNFRGIRYDNISDIIGVATFHSVLTMKVNSITVKNTLQETK